MERCSREIQWTNVAAESMGLCLVGKAVRTIVYTKREQTSKREYYARQGSEQIWVGKLSERMLAWLV